MQAVWYFLLVSDLHVDIPGLVGLLLLVWISLYMMFHVITVEALYLCNICMSQMRNEVVLSSLPFMLEILLM